MANVALKECCVCFGKATIRTAFGMGLQPKVFWVECECGTRTPMCDSPDQAIKIWNWLHRETMSEEKRNKVKQDWLEQQRIKIEEEDKAKKAIVIKPIEKPKKIAKEKASKKAIKVVDKPEVKKKRHRRTKAEMIAARAAGLK